MQMTPIYLVTKINRPNTFLNNKNRNLINKLITCGNKPYIVHNHLVKVPLYLFKFKFLKYPYKYQSF